MKQFDRFLSITALGVFTTLILFGCGSQQALSEDERQKEEWVRIEREYDARQANQIKSIFKHSYVMQIYEPYSGNITSDTIHGSRYVQYDTARIYLDSTNSFANIFTSGLISNRSIYCLLDSSCTPPDPSAGWTYGATGEPILPNIWGWTGPTIFITEMKDIQYVHTKGTQRRFRFNLSFPNPGGGGFSVYLLELTNDDADRMTSFESFMTKARVTYLSYAWSEI